MDATRSSEGIMEKLTAPRSSGVLRPDAPVFTPSSAVTATTTAIPLGSDSAGNAGRYNHENSRMCNHRLDRRQSCNNQKKNSFGRKKSKRQQKREGMDGRRRIEPNTQDTHKNEHKSNGIRNRTKNRFSKGDHSLRSKPKTKNNRKCRQRNQHRMEESNANDKGSASLPRKDNGGNNDNDTSKDELELASPLSFPTLVENPSSSVPSTCHKMQPTKWNNISDLRELREGPQRDLTLKEEPDDEKTESWQNGLYLLTSHDKTTKKNRIGHPKHDFSSRDDENNAEEKEDDNSNSHEMKQYAAINCNSANSPSDTVPGKKDLTRPDKRSFVMKKLRDRWWIAVADQQRRLRHQEAEELNRRQELPSCCVDTGPDMQTNFIGGNCEENTVNISIDNTITRSQDDEIESSSVQEKVKDNLSLYQSTASKIKLLDLIIERNDDKALKDMIESSWNAENEIKPFLDRVSTRHNIKPVNKDQMSLQEDRIEENGIDLVEHAIMIVIRRNHPNLLRTILSVTRGRVPIKSKPLIQAARFGHEECASIILSKQEKGSTLLFSEDVDGNTALHYCCREDGNKVMLLTLLNQVLGNTKRKRQQLSKLVAARNKNLQTPLHIACQSGRNDLVEIFLTTCKGSLLFKILSTEDSNHETPLLCAVSNNSCDIVLSLLMWRRNHDHQRQKQSQLYSATKNLYTNNDNQNQISQANLAQIMLCPLVWAAKSGNLDMLDLLIQFGDQSGTTFQVTEALLTLLRSDFPDETKLKGSNSLILAGGNLFQEIAYPELIDGENTTLISVASKAVSEDIIRSITSTALRIVDEQQLVRRRDPVLQQQPEVFFRTLESKENFEAKRGIINALMETLLRAHSSQKHSEFTKAIALYEKVEKIDEDYIIQLQRILQDGENNTFAHKSKNCCVVATYHHLTGVVTREGTKQSCVDCDRSVFAEKSLCLLKLPWTQNEFYETKCFCPWMSKNAKKSQRSPDLLAEDVVALIANDGSRFLVHAPTVSTKSGKLASALRFAQMTSAEDSFEGTINLEIGIAPDFCKLMIQHMYHGSICFGWPNLEDDEMCIYLLELMLVAEEFLIPSLVQEIEMRLISTSPYQCFCWNCCQGLRFVPSNDAQKEAECLYLTNISNRLVNRDTAMDVLSLTDFIGGLDYSIIMAPIIHDLYIELDQLWAYYDGGMKKQKSWKVNEALATLKHVAVTTILKDFAHVVNCPDFFFTTEGNQDKEFQKQILLKTCLDELQNSSPMAMTYATPIEKLTDAKKKS